jgi:hypothetical protein
LVESLVRAKLVQTLVGNIHGDSSLIPLDQKTLADESPAEVKFYRVIMAMSDEDRSAYERAANALMSPTATVSEKKQVAQKLFEEHPQTLHVFLAGRGLFESLEPEALA